MGTASGYSGAAGSTWGTQPGRKWRWGCSFCSFCWVFWMFAGLCFMKCMCKTACKAKQRACAMRQSACDMQRRLQAVEEELAAMRESAEMRDVQRAVAASLEAKATSEARPEYDGVVRGQVVQPSAPTAPTKKEA